jgi:hypothetical protein
MLVTGRCHFFAVQRPTTHVSSLRQGWLVAHGGGIVGADQRINTKEFLPPCCALN